MSEFGSKLPLRLAGNLLEAGWLEYWLDSNFGAFVVSWILLRADGLAFLWE